MAGKQMKWKMESNFFTNRTAFLDEIDASIDTCTKSNQPVEQKPGATSTSDRSHTDTFYRRMSSILHRIIL